MKTFNLTEHMEREFRYAGMLSGTGTEEEKLIDDLRGFVRLIVSQGHSGATLFNTMNILDRLITGRPLTPLTGRTDEWADSAVSSDVKVNKRCSTVFKHADGTVVDVGMKPVYVYPDGTTVTRSEDPTPVVTFPYMPGFPPTIAATGEPPRA